MNEEYTHDSVHNLDKYEIASQSDDFSRCLSYFSGSSNIDFSGTEESYESQEEIREERDH